MPWFDETEGKRGLTLDVMTVIVRMFRFKAPGEVYSIIINMRPNVFLYYSLLFSLLLSGHLDTVGELLLQTDTPDAD